MTKPHTDLLGRPCASKLAQDVLWAASYAEDPPAPSTGRHHRLKAVKLFQRMLMQDFGPLENLVREERRIAAHNRALKSNQAAQRADQRKSPHERDIERHLVKRTKALGGECHKVQWIGRSGAPDRLVMLPGEDRFGGLPPVTIWVELKAPGKKPEPHQIREHTRMRALGQRVEVIDSFEAVDRLLG